VHGSELSSIELAYELVKQSEQKTPAHNVIIIPSLFPDNAFAANDDSTSIGSTKNTGRYTSDITADPNRQMPSLGKAFDIRQPLDSMERVIELENTLLLQLVQTFRPNLIISLHATRSSAYSGVFADPRADHNSIALGFEEDSTLATSLAALIERNGGIADGNHLFAKPTAVYVNDPPIAPKGFLQQRNFKGSVLNNKRGEGVSLGSWASTAVCDSIDNRDAITILTVEFPGSKRVKDAKTILEKKNISVQLAAYTKAIIQLLRKPELFPIKKIDG
jgi:hypothetical protein